MHISSLCAVCGKMYGEHRISDLGCPGQTSRFTLGVSDIMDIRYAQEIARYLKDTFYAGSPKLEVSTDMSIILS